MNEDGGAQRSSTALSWGDFARSMAEYALVSAGLAGAAWIAWHYLYECIAVLSSAPVLLCVLPGVWIRRGDGLPTAGIELDRRRPVWDALSELYLDTALDALDHHRIAVILHASGYQVGQLDEILYRELHPVLHSNVLDFPGEWAGFDADSLAQRILARSPARSSFAIVPGKWMVRRDWAAVRAQLRTLS